MYINPFELSDNDSVLVLCSTYDSENKPLLTNNRDNLVNSTRNINFDPKFGFEQEFYIMQHYKNFIINRSSFSWWSGYLSNKNKTTIFAPKIWQNDFFLPKSLRSDNWKLF